MSLLGGSFGRRAASFEAGGANAATNTDYFLAGNWDKEDGFRDFSGSEVKQLFGKLRWHGPGDKTLVELSGALADTTLAGTQPSSTAGTVQAGPVNSGGTIFWDIQFASGVCCRGIT